MSSQVVQKCDDPCKKRICQKVTFSHTMGQKLVFVGEGRKAQISTFKGLHPPPKKKNQTWLQACLTCLKYGMSYTVQAQYNVKMRSYAN